MYYLLQSPNPLWIVQANSPAAWFRFGTGITVTGAGVSTWADQSGNGRDLLQAVDAARPPKQADGSILFDGVAQFLKCNTFTLNQPETIYLLAKQITWAVNEAICDGNTVNTGRIFNTTASPTISLQAGSTTNANSDFVLGAYAVVVAVFNGAASVLQINNGAVSSGNPGSGNMAGFTLGAAGDNSVLTNIQVKEVIIFSTAHDADTRTRIIRYLAAVGSLAV